MAFDSFMNDRCDIYHLRDTTETVGYGLPDDSMNDYTYPGEPDEVDVPCHFQRRGGGGALSAGIPQLFIQGEIKLNLGLDVDIRLADRVVDKRTGLMYTAGVPQNIRHSHQAVMLARLYGQEEL